jgi:transposase-like protein
MPRQSTISRADQMRVLLARNTRGEATLRELASEAGVSISTLTNWRRRLRSESDGPSPSFVEVTIASEPAPATPSLFLDRGEHRIEIPQGFCPDHLRRVMEALDEC